jgi:hypothetical protein
MDINNLPRAPAAFTAKMWSESLTAMRRVATQRIGARIALGGRVENYKGRMPGIAEEVLLALQAGRPTYLLGGFGGCTRDITETLGMSSASLVRPVHSAGTWNGREAFGVFRPDSLRNGLGTAENARLAETPHIDEAMTLVLRGLRRVTGAARVHRQSHVTGRTRK